MEEQLFSINVMWWGPIATFIGSILTVIGTILAVHYTNKWTSERYEKDKAYQNKKRKISYS